MLRTEQKISRLDRILLGIFSKKKQTYNSKGRDKKEQLNYSSKWKKEFKFLIEITGIKMHQRLQLSVYIRMRDPTGASCTSPRLCWFSRSIFFPPSFLFEHVSNVCYSGIDWSNVFHFGHLQSPWRAAVVRSNILHHSHHENNDDQTHDLLRYDRPNHPMSTKARNRREANSIGETGAKWNIFSCLPYFLRFMTK